MTSLGWLQLFEALQQRDFLESISPQPPVLYLTITGLTWGLLGSVLVWGLFLGRSWAPRLMQVCSLIYAAAYWLDRLLIADPSAIASRWPFALGLTILLLAYTYWVLSLPSVQVFYNKPNSDRF